MGLGLTITKNIIEITGGEISFTSNKDKGTRFTLSFPTED
jgi:signal transduction histidine kinase